MAIEFNCPRCSRFLTTDDEKAGTAANCPECGEEIEIPAGSDAAGQGEVVADDEPAGEVSPGRLVDPTPGRLDPGEVISTSYAIFKEQMGLVLGGVVIAMIIQQMSSIPLQIFSRVGPFLLADGQVEIGVIVCVIAVLSMLFQIAVSIYTTCGILLLLLNVVKGRPAEIPDLFRGGRYFVPMLLTLMLIYFAIFLLYMVCFAPGIAIMIASDGEEAGIGIGLGVIFGGVALVYVIMFAFMLVYGMFPFVMVDRDARGISSLGQARRLSKGHRFNLFVVGLATVGINLLGVGVCCVGLIFTVPLSYLMITVAYMRMSGQPTISA